MKILLTILAVYLVLYNFDVLYGGQNTIKVQKHSVSKTQDDSTESVKLKKKSPNGALIRSLILPGLGQWYNEQKIKAVLFVSAESFLIGLSFYYNNKAVNSLPGSTFEAFYKDKRNLTYWWIGGFTLLSMLDAYIDAYLYDFDSGPDLSLRVGALQNKNSVFENSLSFGLSLRVSF